MTTLTHTQARQFLLATADGLLADSDQTILAEHLLICAECQDYQAELKTLESRLQSTFGKHRETALISQQVQIPILQTQQRRNIVNARLVSTLKFALGSVILTGLVILMVTSLLNMKDKNISPTAQAGIQTPDPERKITPTPEATQPEIDLSTGRQNGEWIAFITNFDSYQSPAEDRKMDVYLIHPDGSGLVNLTNNLADYYDLQWAPNGEYLAFARREKNTTDLILVDPKEAKPVTLASPTLVAPSDAETIFRWSPDSHQIAFLDKRAGKNDIYRINVDGSGLIQLTNDPDQETEFAWSPDGSQLAVESQADATGSEKLNLHVMNADGSSQNEVAHGMGHLNLRWSLDGKFIYAATDFYGRGWLECNLCFSNPAVYRIDANGQSVQQIFHARDTSGEAAPGSAIFNLYETPDKAVYFQQANPAQNMGLATWMRVDAQSTQTIGKMDPGKVCKTATGNYLEEYISPNEPFSLIANTCAGQIDLYLANRGAATPNEMLTHLMKLPEIIKGQGKDGGMLPNFWSPDGRQVLLEALSTQDKFDLYLLNVEAALQDPTTQPSLLFQSQSYLAGIAWQPASAEKSQTNIPADRLAAFASTESDNSEIYVTRTDGGGVVNLTNNAAYDGNPIWSPDGMQLAFESERDGNREIYVMNLDGSGVTRLTKNPANDILSTARAWSPDGKKLLYTNDHNGKWDLFVAQADGSGVTQLTLDSDQAADDLFFWSPDGQKVAYEIGWATGNKPQVYVINADGTDRQQLPTPKVAFGFSLYSWSTDEQALYYNASDCTPNTSGDCGGPRASLYLVALDGSDPVRLAATQKVLEWVILPEGVSYLDDQLPPMATNYNGVDAWIWRKEVDGNPKPLTEWPNLQEKCQHPDPGSFQVAHSHYADWPGMEKQILVAVYCGKDDQSWLFLVNADGSRRQPLNSVALSGHIGWELHISADGRLALFDIQDSTGQATYALELVAAQNDPTLRPVRLTGSDLRAQPVPFEGLPSQNPVPTPVASPTVQSSRSSSRQDLIAFVRESDLIVMQKDGKGLRQLTKGQFSTIYGPQWSPDGKQISFGAIENNIEGLYLINPDGTGLTRLAAPGWNIATWSPDGNQLAYITGDLQKLAENRIEIIARDGSRVRTIQLDALNGEPNPPSFAIQWSRDGKFIQFLLTKFSGGIPYSPSDRWTIYQASLQDGSLQILLESKIPVANWLGTAGDLTYVTRDEAKEEWQWMHNQMVLATWSLPGYTPYFSSTWSPDRRQLLCTLMGGGDQYQIFLISADHSSSNQIAQGLTTSGYVIEPSWSADGRYLVFSTSLESAGNNDIYLLDVQAALRDPTTRPVRLTTSGFSETQPVWQPKP